MPGGVRMKWIIQKSVQLLAEQPGIGRPGRVAGTREMVVSGLPYVIPYFEQDGSVIILRIMHASMKWPEFFEVYQESI